MALLTREAILGCDDLPRQEVPVPEWGGSVSVRMMTAAERERWEAFVQGETRDRIRATLAARTVCDEAGELLFSEADVEALGAKSGPALTRIFAAALKLNRVSKEDVDELEKNSEAGR